MLHMTTKVIPFRFLSPSPSPPSLVTLSGCSFAQFGSVASASFPSLSESFLGYIDLVNLDLAWMLSAGCLIDTDLYDSLLVSTIGPLAVAGLVLVSRTAALRRCTASDQDRHSKCERRHASALFWVSFLAYSTTSATIFQTFACDDIDDGTSFLRVDHSAQCYTPKHKGCMGYAAVMIIVYAFVIPFSTRFPSTALGMASNLDSRLSRGVRLS